MLNRFLEDIKTYYNEALLSRKEKNLQFTLNYEIDQDVTILTDEIRLKQILDNLIGNAIKFTSEGSVTVNVRMDENIIYFKVADTGIGIPHDQQANIFERFMQAEQGHKMYFGGTGLGLAISKNLIELLGGTIQVKSEPGKGSSFYFHIKTS
jgi:signal transduction histidine kinase